MGCDKRQDAGVDEMELIVDVTMSTYGSSCMKKTKALGNGDSMIYYG